ncbi:uncharacterized protein LOC144162193 [Haemaphysalis longicornis]
MAWTLRTLSGIFIMYYLVIGSMVLFLERYLCVVLSNYLSYQVGAAKDIVRRAVRDGEAQRLAFDVDRIRFSYVATAKIVSQVDSWLRYALVVVFMCSTFVVCMIVYAIFAGNPPSSMVLGTAFYAMFTYLAIVDVALSASDIKTQGRKLKSVLQSASTTEVPARIARQMELFSMTIDEEQLCFSGHGFFTVDRPMLTSFLAVVMTYSLLLIQTSGGLETPHCATHTSTSQRRV